MDITSMGCRKLPPIFENNLRYIVVVDNDLPKNTIVTNKSMYDFIITKRNHIAIKSYMSCLALNDEDMFKNILHDDAITSINYVHISLDIAHILNVDFDGDFIEIVLFPTPVKFHRIDTFGPIQY